MDFQTECGIEMIKYFQYSVSSNSQVGKLLLLQLQASQVESGCPEPLLEKYPEILIPYLTPTWWILSMRQFMSHRKITITASQCLNESLKSATDSFIMSSALLKGYSVRQQIDLNLVRIYLQVTTLDNMTDLTDRSKIAVWAFDANPPAFFSSQKSWPRQEPPSTAQRRLWRHYISSNFLRNDRFWHQSPRARLRDLKSKRATSPPLTTITGMISTLPK